VAGTGAIEVEGVVAEVLPRVCRVELSNGHRVLAHLAAKLNTERLLAGDVVTMEVSPFDLSKGRIVKIKTRT
jgi:translation initiation factor IF-1